MTVTDRLERYLRAHPCQWIDGLELARVGGSYGWRSRCSDLRRRGMAIENRQERRQGVNGLFTRSLYRYVPAAEPTVAPEPYDANAAPEGRLL